MKKIDWSGYINTWRKMGGQPSGNYASNMPLDIALLDRLLENNVDDERLANKVIIKPKEFKKNNNNIDRVTGLNVLAGLQDLYKNNCVTVFRAIRFPTPKRIVELVSEKGISMLNYEHERLLKIYEDKHYKRKRSKLLKDPLFSFVPQERIVPGLPVFFNVNDAIHIHRAYRGEKDIILIVVAHIPYDLVKNDAIEFFSNYALVENYYDSKGDKKINFFKRSQNTGQFKPYYDFLKWEGNNVYEVFLKGIPADINNCNEINIEQRFFLLEIYKPLIDFDQRSINGYNCSNELFKGQMDFLYGFWGDDNIFMRRPSEYLPNNCYELLSK